MSTGYCSSNILSIMLICLVLYGHCDHEAVQWVLETLFLLFLLFLDKKNKKLLDLNQEM